MCVSMLSSPNVPLLVYWLLFGSKLILILIGSVLLVILFVIGTLKLQASNQYDLAICPPAMAKEGMIVMCISGDTRAMQVCF